MFVTKGFLLTQTFSKSNVGFYCGHSLSMELTRCKYIKSYSALFCSLEHDQDDSNYLYQVQEHMLSCVVSCSYTCDMVEWMAVWVRMCVCVCVCVCVCLSHSVVYNSLQPHESQTPLSMEFFRQEYWSRLSFPLRGIFPTQGLNPGLLHCRQILYCLSHQGNPWVRISMSDSRSIKAHEQNLLNVMRFKEHLLIKVIPPQNM